MAGRTKLEIVYEDENVLLIKQSLQACFPSLRMIRQIRGGIPHRISLGEGL